jgi:hypothetical protein
LLHLGIERRPARLATRVSPGVGDQPAVPAQQRLGLDDETGPAGSGQHPADRGKQSPVGGLQLRTSDLAAQHGELMPQHEDLQVLGSVTVSTQDEQLE